jgi:hypothetical protein
LWRRFRRSRHRCQQHNKRDRHHAW